jgi:hypothetical protein
MKAGTYGVGLKEHNADYLSDILYMHPVFGITAVNVAPEFGVNSIKKSIERYVNCFNLL